MSSVRPSGTAPIGFTTKIVRLLYAITPTKPTTSTTITTIFMVGLSSVPRRRSCEGRRNSSSESCALGQSRGATAKEVARPLHDYFDRRLYAAGVARRQHIGRERPCRVRHGHARTTAEPGPRPHFAPFTPKTTNMVR